MFLGAVAAQPVPGNFELLCSIAETQETKHPEQDANGLSRHHLDGAHINGLRVVAQPVAKVDTLDIHLAKLLARSGRDEQCQQCVLDISMTPVLPLDFTQARNVASTKSVGGAGPENEKEKAWQPNVTE